MLSLDTYSTTARKKGSSYWNPILFSYFFFRSKFLGLKLWFDHFFFKSKKQSFVVVFFSRWREREMELSKQHFQVRQKNRILYTRLLAALLVCVCVSNGSRDFIFSLLFLYILLLLGCALSLIVYIRPAELPWKKIFYTFRRSERLKITMALAVVCL